MVVAEYWISKIVLKNKIVQIMITQTYSAEYKVCVQINFPMIFMTNKYMTKYI